MYYNGGDYPIEIFNGRVKVQTSIMQRELLQRVSMHHSMFREPEMQAMLTCIIETMRELIEQNCAVFLEGLGSFRPRIYTDRGKRYITVQYLPHPDMLKKLKKKKIVDITEMTPVVYPSIQTLTDKELKRRYDKQRRAKK